MLLLPLCVTPLLGGCAPIDGPTLRVVTWNVHACQSGLDRIVSELHRLEPDVVFLQEVSSGQLESQEANAAEQIARRLAMHHVCTPVPAAGSKEEQVAIFARGELEDAEFLDAGTGRHYGITAEVDLRDDRDVRLVCVHLTSNAPVVQFGRFLVTGGRRLTEIDDLTRRLKSWKGENVILAGDFNSMPTMFEHAAIRARARWIVSLKPTFSSNNPVMQLDHVFIKGGFKPGRIFTEPTDASDHRPLVADIRVVDPLGLLGPSGAALFEPADSAIQ